MKDYIVESSEGRFHWWIGDWASVIVRRSPARLQSNIADGLLTRERCFNIENETRKLSILKDIHWTGEMISTYVCVLNGINIRLSRMCVHIIYHILMDVLRRLDPTNDAVLHVIVHRNTEEQIHRVESTVAPAIHICHWFVIMLVLFSF